MSFSRPSRAGERIFELLDRAFRDRGCARRAGRAVEGHVAFDDVHFAYSDGASWAGIGRIGTRRDQRCLQRRDLSKSQPGQMVALVGPSGAGKTSIANLLCRFYDPQQGAVAVDGMDLRQVSLASLRSQVGVVLQDTFLFNATVRENLLYGKPDASEDELVAAAKTAYAHEFILELPKGYDTEIGERGVRLERRAEAASGPGAGDLGRSTHPDPGRGDLVGGRGGGIPDPAGAGSGAARDARRW